MTTGGKPSHRDLPRLYWCAPIYRPPTRPGLLHRMAWQCPMRSFAALSRNRTPPMVCSSALRRTSLFAGAGKPRPTRASTTSRRPSPNRASPSPVGDPPALLRLHGVADRAVVVRGAIDRTQTPALPFKRSGVRAECFVCPSKRNSARARMWAAEGLNTPHCPCRVPKLAPRHADAGHDVHGQVPRRRRLRVRAHDPLQVDDRTDAADLRWRALPRAIMHQYGAVPQRHGRAPLPPAPGLRHWHDRGQVGPSGLSHAAAVPVGRRRRAGAFGPSFVSAVERVEQLHIVTVGGCRCFSLPVCRSCRSRRTATRSSDTMARWRAGRCAESTLEA